MLLERDEELARLSDLLDQVGETGGKVVLVRGEAGIGKSALVGEFLESCADSAHVHLGFCDDLQTPQPLAPIWDIARDEPPIADALSHDDRRTVMEALLDLLLRRLRPTVVVLEDTQWADEATLDVIKFVGRRVGRTNGLLVLTYRDGVVDSDHPLRQVIGELPPGNVVRIPLGRLSPAAIARMIEERAFDLDAVIELTGGNPLFVAEVVASGLDVVPATVQDSVLSRAFKVSPEAKRLLDLVSVSPGGSEWSLVDEILEPTREQLDECVRQDLIRLEADTISFRHELQRRAVESALAPAERRRLNEQVLTALGESDDPARLVHHAKEAGDVDAIIEFAPRAARAAVAIESHREALAHFRALEPHLDRVAVAERAALLEEWAREEFLLDHPEALGILARALELYRASGDERSLARALAFAVRVYEVNGRPEEAEASAVEAVTLLEAQPPSADLAFAVCQQSWLRLMKGDDDALGIQLADRAISIAEEIGDDLTVARALILKGAIAHSSVDTGAISLVEEGFRRAEAGGHRFDEVYALINLAGLAADIRQVERASDMVQRARNSAERYEIRSLEIYAKAMHAEILLWQGDWAKAEDLAAEVLGAHPHAELLAWRILGNIQARRGRAEAAATLARMWALAQRSAELQNLDPAAAALAEHMWLSDRFDPELSVHIGEVLDRGMRSGFVWPSGALAFWAWKLGILAKVPERLSEFYRWIIEGDWRTAADFWEARRVPYEQALALMHGDDGARIQAVRIFEDLGATAAAGRLRRLLGDDGVKVPRGKARSTRSHTAGLTARQAEVLDLLAEGLSNVEIADRLFVSPRTVENHVSAILMKLDVSTREAAVGAARDRGLLIAT